MRANRHLPGVLRFVTACAVSCALIVRPFADDAHSLAAPPPTNELIDMFAQSGVAVYQTYTSPAPIRPIEGRPSAVKLTFWQVANLAREANAHGGYLGSRFDTLARLQKGKPPFSYFIAAWVRNGTTPAAWYAKQVMGKQDWKHAPRVVYPLLVMVLFIADAARPTPGVTHKVATFDIARVMGAPAEAGGVCSAAAGFVTGVINDVFNALQVSSDSFWAKLWNGVLDLVKGVVYVVIGTTLKPLIDILTTAATAIAMVQMVTSTLLPWQAEAFGNPSVNRFGISPNPGNPGDLTVQITAPEIPLPQDVIDCASAVGVNLKDVTYVGSPVAWNQIIGIPQYGTQESRDNAIRPDKTATLHYRSRVESPPPACALETAGVITVNVRVRREDVSKLWDVLNGLIINQLPAKLADLVKPIILSKLQPIRDALLDFKNPSAIGSAIVLYHEIPPDCGATPPPVVTPTPRATPNPGRFARCEDLLSAYEVGAFLGHLRVVLHGDGRVCYYLASAADAPEPEAVATVIIWPPSYAAAFGQAPGAAPLDVGSGAQAFTTSTCSDENESPCASAFVTKNGKAVQISVTGTKHVPIQSPRTSAAALARLAAQRM